MKPQHPRRCNQITCIQPSTTPLPPFGASSQQTSSLPWRGVCANSAWPKNWRRPHWNTGPGTACQTTQVHGSCPLQTAQGRGAGNIVIHADGRLHGHVLAPGLVVVQIFPAQCKSIHALAQHVHHGVCDQCWVARISNAARRRSNQAKFAIGGTEQHHSGIAGHAATVKAAFHNAPAKAAKFDLACLDFFGTVWRWRSCVAIGVRYQ